MRVAIVLPRGGRFCMEHPNSMETVVRTLLAASVHRRSAVVICDEGAVRSDSTRLITLTSGLSRGARDRAVVDALKALQPDVIEYHQNLKSAAEIARRTRAPNQIFYRHTALKAPRNPIEGLRYRARLRSFQKLVFVSDAARLAFLKDYAAFAGVSTTVCNPVDATLWKGQANLKDRSILFAGRPTADKGFDLVCSALAGVLDRSPDWSATLMLAEFERHAEWAQACIDPLVRFGDRVRIVRSAPLGMVQAAARAAAIALVPSRAPETLGLSAIEAHAAGAAVVSSGRGGLLEASGNNAVFIDPDRPQALPDAIEALIAEPVRRLSLARAGQHFALTTHAPTRRAKELDAVRWSLAQRRSSGVRPTTSFAETRDSFAPVPY